MDRLSGHSALAEVATRRADGRAVRQAECRDGEGADPEGEAMLADSVGVALLVVLDTLTPAERLAFAWSLSDFANSRSPCSRSV
jgi:hypothetical protein